MSVVRTLTIVLRSVPILLVATSAPVMMATLGTLTVTLAMVSTLLTLGVHAQEGYCTCPVCLCVCYDFFGYIVRFYA